MHGPIEDAVILLLLILLFASEQRRRPEMYFRFWTCGWVFTFLAYIFWEPTFSSSILIRYQDLVRFVFILIGALSFSLAYLVTPERLRQTVGLGGAIAVPTCVGVGLQTFQDVLPRALRGSLLPALLGLIVVGHAAAVVTVAYELPREWKKLRAALFALIAFFGVSMFCLMWWDETIPLPDLILAEVFFVTAVLYSRIYGRGTGPGKLGVAGFAWWGILYLAGLALAHFGYFHVLKWLWMIWNVPKYTVAISMILKIFDDSARDEASLATRYRRLYDDFRLLYENHPNPIFICEAGTRRILHANLTAVLDYGYSQQELLAMSAKDLEAEQDEDSRRIETMIPYPAHQVRARFRRKDGRTLWVHVQEQSAQFQGVDARMIMARDISERLHLNLELAEKALVDPLTGLPNRRYLQEQLETMLAISAPEGKKAALLTIDVDHFKAINDAHGHQAGDACLKEVAARLQSRIRKTDLLARIGGEEFVAVISELRSAADAEAVAWGLVRSFEQPLQMPDLTLPVTISVGVAVYPDASTEMETLSRLSDEALYRAKRGGRNRVASALAPNLAMQETEKIEERSQGLSASHLAAGFEGA
jgi:diguanylate cyclase (GGDEF)-like protein/PAS domain S-box-containing protein